MLQMQKITNACLEWRLLHVHVNWIEYPSLILAVSADYNDCRLFNSINLYLMLDIYKYFNVDI